MYTSFTTCTCSYLALIDLPVTSYSMRLHCLHYLSKLLNCLPRASSLLLFHWYRSANTTRRLRSLINRKIVPMGSWETTECQPVAVVSRCINCSCSKLGRSCTDCLPLCRGRCQNKAVSQGSTSASASASASAVKRKGHGRNVSSATVPAVKRKGCGWHKPVAACSVPVSVSQQLASHSARSSIFQAPSVATATSTTNVSDFD